MKGFVVMLLLMFVLSLVACGGGYGGMSNANVNTSSIDGNWSTTMLNSSGAQMIAFTSAITHSGTYTVTATNIQFTLGMACFPNGASATGAVMPNGNINSFGMTAQGANTSGMGNTVLTLQGSVTNANAISGTWTMNGITSGCSGSGTFTMTKM